MKNNIVRIISLVAVGLSVLSCQTQPREPLRNRPELQPINSVRVGDFKCDNEVIGQAVRTVFMELIADYADAKVVREGEADVVIEGTVTLAQGDSSSVGIGGGASAIFGKGARDRKSVV